MKLETCLSGAPLFAGMARGDLTHLLDCLMLDCVWYKKTDAIVTAGTAQTSIGLIARGTAQADLALWNGAKKFVRVLTAGDCFGLETAFSAPSAPCEPMKWASSVVATRDCQVVFLDAESIFTSCEKKCPFHERFRENLIRVTSRAMYAQSQRISLLTTKSMRGRITGYLLQQLAEEGADLATLSLPFNRNQLAAHLDVSRPSMSRELAHMKAEGLLDYYLDTIQILDIKALTEKAKEEN